MSHRRATRCRLAAALVLCVPVLACQGPRLLLVGKELAELQPLVSRAVSADPGVGTWSVQPDSAAVPANAVVVRLTTTPGWNLSGPQPAARIPDSWRADRAYAIPPSLERFARADGSSWEAIPLFFDAWGQTRLRPGMPGSRPGPVPGWHQLISRGAARSVVVAGSRPSFRQWALVAETADPASRVTSLPGWFTRGAQGWENDLRALTTLKRAAAWAANTWYFADEDLHHGYPAVSPLVILATFRDYERSEWTGARSFSPFVLAGPSGTVLGGSVVFAELRGDPRRWTDAAALLRLLASPGFQREVAATTKWLAANLEAPELDDTGAAVRYLARQARAFVPVTDRLPQPLAEGSLFVEAQLAVDRAPRE